MKRYSTIFIRVKGMMFSPLNEWKAVADEKRTVIELFLSYILPLLLVTMLASYIGYGIVGSKQSMFGLVASEKLGYRYAFFYSLLILFSIFASTAIISFIANFFHANRNFTRNFRFITYSFTPMIASSVLLILPFFSFLFYLSGIYNILVLYSGFNRMTCVPKERKWKYFAVTIAVLVFVCAAMIRILKRTILD